MFNDKGQILMFFGGPGKHPGAMSMPAGVTTCDTDLDLFAKYVHPAFDAQRLVLVTNNLSPLKINVYALGQLKPGKTVADISNNRVQGVFGFADEQPADTGVLKLPEGLTTQPATLPATMPAPPAATAPAATEAKP
jgi:hypothetical protein